MTKPPVAGRRIAAPELSVLSHLPLAVVGLVFGTGLAAQTTITTDGATVAIGTSATMPAGLSAVSVGTADDPADGNTIVVGQGVTLESDDVATVRVVSGGNNTIVNDGTLVLSNFGAAIAVEAGAGNTITNTGSIVSVDYGILIANENSGAIANAGRIAAGWSGIEAQLGNSGSIRNTASGSITGQYTGVMVIGDNTGTIANAGTIEVFYPGVAVIGGNSGLMENAGSIRAARMGGLYVGGDNAGVVRNAAGASLEAGAGPAISLRRGNAASGIVENAGSISARGQGIAVRFTNAGTISNTGSIEADASGIEVRGRPESEDDVTTLVNSGAILNSGSIVAGEYGIAVGQEAWSFYSLNESSGPVPVANSGRIENVAGATISSESGGIYLFGWNTGTVLNAGSISSAPAGITVLGVNSGTVANSGAIAATSFGIRLGNTNQGTFSNSGTISCEGDGMYVRGANQGTIVNSGALESTDGSGIYLRDANELGAPVANSGRIAASYAGLYLRGVNAGTVANSGSLSADTGILVRGTTGLDTPSVVNSGTILNSGRIEARDIGIHVGIEQDDEEPMTRVSNTGMIENAAGATIAAERCGIWLDDSNAGTIRNAGAIEGGVFGIYADGNSGRIENAATGSLSVATDSEAGGGILVNGANSGVVENAGSIVSSGYGIHIGGESSGRIVNTGRIEAGGAGIDAAAHAAEIVSSGAIVAGTDGIWAQSSAGSIRNEGTIDAAGCGIRVEGSVTGSFANTGAIRGKDGLWVLDSVRGDFSNTGTISSERVGAVVYGGIDGSFVNSGTIEGASAGLGILGPIGGTFANSGTIGGARGIGLFLYGGAAEVSNSGRISGGLGVELYGADMGLFTNTGTIEGTRGYGLAVFGEVAGVRNYGTITATGEGATALILVDGVPLYNAGTISAVGEDAVAVRLETGGQTLISSGRISGEGTAISAMGGDRVIFAAPSATNGAAGPVSGAIVSRWEAGTLYFGAAHDVGPTSDLSQSKAAAFDIVCTGRIENFGAAFLSGTTVLNGDGALHASAILPGATLAANGTLVFSGSTGFPAGIALPGGVSAADCPLYNAGTLRGGGTVVLRSSAGGLGTLLSPGTLTAGNSIGRLTIDGNVALSGVLQVEVDPSAASPVAGVNNDLIVVGSGLAGQTATFTLAAGSRIDLVAVPGSAAAVPGTTYDFLAATATSRIVVEGTPSSRLQLLDATDNLADRRFYIVGTGGTAASPAGLRAVVARDYGFDKSAATANQAAVGRHLGACSGESSFQDLLAGLNLIASDAELNLALERLSGELYPSLVELERERLARTLSGVAAILRPADTVPAGAMPGWYTFARVGGTDADYADDASADIDGKTRSALVGAGRQLGERWEVGGFVNAGDGEATNSHPDKTDTDSCDFGLFVRYNDAGDYCHAGIAYGVGWHDIVRQAAVARTHAVGVQPAVVARAETDSAQLAGYVEKGYTFGLGHYGVIQPFVAVQFAHVSFDSVAERDGGRFDLAVDFEDCDSARAALGLGWRFGLGRILGARLRGGWSREFGDKAARAIASFPGVAGGYRLTGLELGADRFDAGLDLEARLAERVSATLRTEYSGGSGVDAVSLDFGVLYRW